MTSQEGQRGVLQQHIEEGTRDMDVRGIEAMPAATVETPASTPFAGQKIREERNQVRIT
jgi:hypothetical protein